MDNKPRPGEADTSAFQPDPEAIRRPGYEYEEQEQGIRHVPDPEELKDQQDRGLMQDSHKTPGTTDETKD